MLAVERRDRITALLQADGRVLAADLADRLDVSLDTVRRDLQELASTGALRRVHGGAVPALAGPPRFVDRLPDDAPAKARVAEVAAGLVVPGEVLALSGGTTILHFARALDAGLRATAIATNPDIAVALADHAGLTVDLIGGRLHPDARTVTGPEAVDAWRRVRPDLCVLSACSLDPRNGMTLRHREEAEVVRAMVAAAGRVMSVTTQTKLGTAAPYPVAGIDRIDVLVTDAPADAVAAYREHGMTVVHA